MLRQGPTKVSAFLLVVILAFTIAGIGIFLDGNVIQYSMSSENTIQETAAKSSFDLSANQSTATYQPSEVIFQLKPAFNAANQMNFDERVALSGNKSASNEKITEAGQLLEEK